MKTTNFVAVFAEAAAVAVAVMMVGSCALDRGFDFEPQSAGLRLSYPDLPAAWREVLGEAAWMVEWYGPDGALKRAEQPDSIEIPVGTAVPVSAFPHWPRAGLRAGLARPAGAVYPFAVRDGELALSWGGGVAAAYFRAMLSADGQDRYHPALFDWPRFIALLDDPSVDEDFRADPWAADWAAIGARTRASGFDRRRLTLEERAPMRLAPPAPGPWVASSPYLVGPAVDADGYLSIFAGERPDAFLSVSGYLRYRRGFSAWFPAGKPENRLVPLDRLRYTPCGEREAACDRAYTR
jgi:hypothetical protein